MLFFFEETLCDLFAVCRLGFCVSWFFVTDGIFCRLALCEVNFKISPFFSFFFSLTSFVLGTEKLPESTMEKHCQSCRDVCVVSLL